MSETTEAPATEATETPNPAPTEGTQTTEAPAAPEAPEPEPAAPETPPKEDWREARIRQQAAKNAALLREIEELKSRQTPNQAATPQPPFASDDERKAWVAQEVAQQRFNEACDTTYHSGKAKFPDFDIVAQGYGLVGGPTKPFLEAVTALDHGADVFYALGKDPREAERLMALPPTKMAIELARMEAKLTAPPPPKQISRAPTPVTPLGGGISEPEPNLDDTTDGARWIAERERQEAARRKNGLVRRQ